MIRLLLISVFYFVSASSAFAGRIDLVPRLAAELNQILKVSESLQLAMLNKSEDQLDISVREVVSQIERTVSLSKLAKPHERNHLLRILRTARENFELAQGSFGKERDSHLENGLNQLVNIVRIYKVDRVYGIFFCSKDKNSWVQRGKKPQNPFRGPASKVDCGMRVAE